MDMNNINGFSFTQAPQSAFAPPHPLASTLPLLNQGTTPSADFYAMNTGPAPVVDSTAFNYAPTTAPVDLNAEAGVPSSPFLAANPLVPPATPPVATSPEHSAKAIAPTKTTPAAEDHTGRNVALGVTALATAGLLLLKRQDVGEFLGKTFGFLRREGEELASNPANTLNNATKSLEEVVQPKHPAPRSSRGGGGGTYTPPSRPATPPPTASAPPASAPAGAPAPAGDAVAPASAPAPAGDAVAPASAPAPAQRLLAPAPDATAGAGTASPPAPTTASRVEIPAPDASTAGAPATSAPPTTPQLPASRVIGYLPAGPVDAPTGALPAPAGVDNYALLDPNFGREPYASYDLPSWFPSRTQTATQPAPAPPPRQAAGAAPSFEALLPIEKNFSMVTASDHNVEPLFVLSDGPSLPFPISKNTPPPVRGIFDTSSAPALGEVGAGEVRLPSFFGLPHKVDLTPKPMDPELARYLKRTSQGELSVPEVVDVPTSVPTPPTPTPAPARPETVGLLPKPKPIAGLLPPPGKSAQALPQDASRASARVAKVLEAGEPYRAIKVAVSALQRNPNLNKEPLRKQINDILITLSSNGVKLDKLIPNDLREADKIGFYETLVQAIATNNQHTNLQGRLLEDLADLYKSTNPDRAIALVKERLALVNSPNTQVRNVLEKLAGLHVAKKEYSKAIKVYEQMEAEVVRVIQSIEKATNRPFDPLVDHHGLSSDLTSIRTSIVSLAKRQYDQASQTGNKKECVKAYKAVRSLLKRNSANEDALFALAELGNKHKNSRIEKRYAQKFLDTNPNYSDQVVQARGFLERESEEVASSTATELGNLEKPVAEVVQQTTPAPRPSGGTYTPPSRPQSPDAPPAGAPAPDAPTTPAKPQTVALPKANSSEQRLLEFYLELSDYDFEYRESNISEVYYGLKDKIKSGKAINLLEDIVPFHQLLVERAKKLGLTDALIGMRTNMASLYKLQGQNNHAIKELKLACQEHPDSFAPIKDLALLLEPKEALTLLQKFIARKGYDNVIEKSIDDKCFYAEALLKAGDKEKAKEIAQEIVDTPSLDKIEDAGVLRQAKMILGSIEWSDRRKR